MKKWKRTCSIQKRSTSAAPGVGVLCVRTEKFHLCVSVRVCQTRVSLSLSLSVCVCERERDREREREGKKERKFLCVRERERMCV